MGTADVEAFLNHLVGERHLAASTQNQALNALVFLYRHVVEDAIAPDHLGKFELLRSTRPARLPTVLSADEVTGLLAAIPRERNARLMAELLYGTGMRVGECCTLRVRDIDLGRAQIIIRAGKGDQDRLVMLPRSLEPELCLRLRRAAERHEPPFARLTPIARPAVRRIHLGSGRDVFGFLPFSSPAEERARDPARRGAEAAP